MIGEKEETPQNHFVFHKTCGMQKAKGLKRGKNRVWKDRYQPLVSVIANRDKIDESLSPIRNMKIGVGCTIRPAQNKRACADPICLG